MSAYYTDYAEYLQQLFPGTKVQKLSVNTGAGCPNRDGTIGTGGCIYCDNRSFTPSYCQPGMSVAEQLEAGKQFFGRKYPQMKYLAYFQSFTSTHNSIDTLMRQYREALSVPDIVGIVIGTRPDCMPDELLNKLAALPTCVIIEYGAESSHDDTLRLINRHHTWQQVCDAVERTAAIGISCGLHLIAGLPGETDEDVLCTIRRAVALPIDTLKIHQLQVIKGTLLHLKIQQGAIQPPQYSLEQYIALCVKIIKEVGRASKPIAIERFLSQAPPEMVVSPRWGLKNYQFVNLLHAQLITDN